MKKLNNMVIVERKIVNGTQSKGRIDVNFATKRQCMPIERATRLKEEDELMTQENDSVSLFEILGDAYQVDVKVGSKTVSRILLLEEVEEVSEKKEEKPLFEIVSKEETKETEEISIVEVIEEKIQEKETIDIEISEEVSETKRGRKPKTEK